VVVRRLAWLAFAACLDPRPTSQQAIGAGVGTGTGSCGPPDSFSFPDAPPDGPPADAFQPPDASGAGPALQVPGSIQLVDRAVGTTATDMPLMLTNTGTASSTIETPTGWSGPPMLSTSFPGGTMVPPGPPGRPMLVLWMPTTPNFGVLGTITVTHDGVPSMVQVSGSTYTQLTAPASFDFGTLCTNQAATQQLALGKATVGTAKLTGSTISEGMVTYTEVHNFAELPPDGPGAVAVTAMSATTGTRDGVLDLSTNVPNSQTVHVALTANIIASGIATSPVALGYGTVLLGSMAQDNVTIGNCDATGNPLTLMSAEVTPMSVQNDYIVGMLPGTVPSGVSVVVPVTFKPQMEGDRAATLTIMTSGSPIVVQLDGTGQKPVAPPGDDAGVGSGTDTGKNRSTYYECSAGGVTASWPVGVAVVFALRRRRRASQS
jgi:uncharacterized protein (TIGR03382 family)